MPTLRISLVQAALRWHDAQANRKLFADVLGGLDGPTDLIVLPEMFTTGFTMQAAGQSESMDGASVQWMRSQAERLKAAVCGSLIIEDDGRFFNRFVFVEPGGDLQCYDKRHLFRLANEQRHYSAGRRRVVFDYRGVRICPQVCYDLRFPVWSRNRGDYDLLIYVANWPQPRHLAWQTLIRARAIENQCYLAAVNRVGTDGNDLPYRGGSAVVDFLGQDLVDLDDEPASATVEIDLDRLRTFRERYPFHQDADAFELDIAADDH